MKRVLRRMAVNNLPEGYDIDTHFKPRYNPWDQRLCLILDADVYKTIADGRADVVTEEARGCHAGERRPWAKTALALPQ